MRLKRKPAHQADKLPLGKIFGGCIMAFGIILIILAGFSTWQNWIADNSSLMAIGFILPMLGIAVYFPELLTSTGRKAISSTRICVYLIICMFVFLYVKIGWQCHHFSDLQLGRNWVYLLGIALGSNVLQSFFENRITERKHLNLPYVLVNTGPNAAPTPPVESISVQDQSIIHPMPPVHPPDYIIKSYDTQL